MYNINMRRVIFNDEDVEYVHVDDVDCTNYLGCMIKGRKYLIATDDSDEVMVVNINEYFSRWKTYNSLEEFYYFHSEGQVEVFVFEDELELYKWMSNE